jgi:AcrR family transcriptional regulator
MLPAGRRTPAGFPNGALAWNGNSFYFGHVSSQTSAASRRALRTRPPDMVDRLMAAAAQELEDVGAQALSIRHVAQRAGMSPATAYSYLTSKEHLFAELFWRHLSADPGPVLAPGTAADRLGGTVEHLMTVIRAAPETAAAATQSLLGGDPQVARLRPRIGGLFVQRFREALGDDADPRVLDTVSLAFFGALLQVGMGLGTHEEFGRRLQDAVTVIMEEAG